MALWGNEISRGWAAAAETSRGNLISIWMGREGGIMPFFRSLSLSQLFIYYRRILLCDGTAATRTAAERTSAITS